MQRDDTKGAKQIDDSGETKTDLPVDQQKAEEVPVSKYLYNFKTWNGTRFMTYRVLW